MHKVAADYNGNVRKQQKCLGLLVNLRDIVKFLSLPLADYPRYNGGPTKL